jgi:hypothetical protein
MALIGWWPLDGSTEDYTVNKNNGVPTNVTYVNGKIGQAGSFNGSSSNIVIPLLSFAGEFSYALWINTSNTTDTRMFFGGNLSTSSSIKYGFLGGNFFIRVISSNQQVTIPNISNTWTHFVIRRNSDNKIDLFINGVGQRLFSDGAQAGTTFLNVIGNVSDGSGQWFLGSLNDVRIYDHALSQKEINDLVKAKVLQYNFNKDDALVMDASGYKRYGVSSGNPIISNSISKLGTGSLQMNGSSQYVDTNFGLNYNPSTNPITFCLWVKTNDTSASDMYLATSNGSNQRMYIAQYLGYWDIGIQTSAWLSPGSGVLVTTNWTHLALRMNGTSAEFFVNGNLVQTKNYTNYTFARNIWIGHNGTVSYTPNGNIDDVRIYATALSDADILDLYQTRAKIDNQGNLYANEFVEDYEVAPGLTLTGLFDTQLLDNDFSEGTSGYTAHGSSVYSISSNGNMLVTANGTQLYGWIYKNNSAVNTRTYYINIKAKVTNSDCVAISYWRGGNFAVMQANPVINTFYELSDIYTHGSSGPFTLIEHKYANSTIANGKVMEMDYYDFFDITNKLSTIGYTPTKAQMDSWYKDYSRSRTKQNGQVISAELSETDTPDQPMKIFRDKIQIQGEIKEV